MRRKNWTVALAILTLTVTISCGGGGGGDSPTGGGTTIVAADFTPTELNPGANTVSALGSSRSNIVTLSVMVTGTAGVYGASFDLVYDPTVAEFAGYSPGNLLESGGQQVTYQVNAQQAGRVIVGVARTTGVGIDAGVSTALIQLQLRATSAGASAISFQNADLLNSNNPPTEIVGIAFTGGTLTAN
jgi:hypothetical protein